MEHHAWNSPTFSHQTSLHNDDLAAFMPSYHSELKSSQSNSLVTSNPVQQYHQQQIQPAQTQAQPQAQTQTQQPSLDQEILKQMKLGFEQISQQMQRLEQRMSRVEQTTSIILKNQQEVLSTPFMSNEELDKARKMAEQMERDNSVAKQLQAAYNKETEVRRSVAQYSNTVGSCPICGAHVNGLELESHVDKCLLQFSDDPKKAKEVKETKQKVEQGFFSRLYKTTESKKTKVISQNPPTTQTTTTVEHEGVSAYPYFSPQMAPGMYPQFIPMSGHPQNQQMMMPMYMYPSYPGTQSNNNN